MSLYKRGNTWYIQIKTPDGRRIQKSTGTSIKKDAEQLHDQLKADMWRVVHLGEKPTYYWEDIVVDWLDEKGVEGGKKSLDTDKGHFRLLDSYLGGKALYEIGNPIIDQFKKDRLAAGKKPATVDRTLSLLKAVLNKAKDKGWIDSAPVIGLYRPDNEIVSFISKEEAARLISCAPEWLADLIIVALATGLRESDLLGLEWRRVDLKRRYAWIERKTTKGVKSIPIPMNDEAWHVVEKYVGQHQQYVFTVNGERIKKAGKDEWQRTLKRAKIINFRWHDLRHTWASWHVQAGTPLRDLMDLGGWASIDMVLRYGHLRRDDLEKHKNNTLISSHSVSPSPSSPAAIIAVIRDEEPVVIKNDNVIPLFSRRPEAVRSTGT